MGYIPLLLMSSFLLLVPGNTLDFTDSISLYIFFGLRALFRLLAAIPSLPF